MNNEEYNEEYMGHLCMPDDDIFDKFWDETRARDGEGTEHCKIDVSQFYLSNNRDQGSEVYRFVKLTKFSQDVLVLPHSNVQLERLFNTVKKNKTDTRSSLKLDETFSNILTVKSRYLQLKILCHKWKPSGNLTADAKSATVKGMKKTLQSDLYYQSAFICSSVSTVIFEYVIAGWVYTKRRLDLDSFKYTKRRLDFIQVDLIKIAKLVAKYQKESNQQLIYLN